MRLQPQRRIKRLVKQPESESRIFKSISVNIIHIKIGSMYFKAISAFLFLFMFTAQQIDCVNVDDNARPQQQAHKRRHRFNQKYAPPEDKGTNLLPSRRSKASLQSKNTAQQSKFQLELSSEGEDSAEDEMLKSGHSEVPYVHGPSNQLQTYDITQYRLLASGDFYCTHCGYAFHNPHKDCHTSRSFSEEFI